MRKENILKENTKLDKGEPVKFMGAGKAEDLTDVPGSQKADLCRTRS